ATHTRMGRDDQRRQSLYRLRTVVDVVFPWRGPHPPDDRVYFARRRPEFPHRTVVHTPTPAVVLSPNCATHWLPPVCVVTSIEPILGAGYCVCGGGRQAAEGAVAASAAALRRSCRRTAYGFCMLKM